MIDVELNLIKYGIIGNGNHSKRIQNILKKKKLNFLIYKPSKPNYFDKEKFLKLKSCDAVFIVSPDKTHFSYIKKLYKHCYIFCEKMPVTKINDLKKLKKIDNKKIYFNFNDRFSHFGIILKNLKKYKLKNLIYANIISSHGLALKNEYKKSWRSNFKKCPKGVYQLVSIHYIDLINYFFKIDKIETPNLINFSKIGTSFDTSSSKIMLKNKAIIELFTTYNSSFYKKFSFVFENGIIDFSHNKLTIRGPSKTFNKNGLFITPKIKYQTNINDQKDFLLSLEKSVDFFVKQVKKKMNFKMREFRKSLETNLLLLEK